MIVLAIALGAFALLMLLLLVTGGMLVNIGGQQVGVVERKYFGRPLPEGRVVALPGEVGIQAKVLQPGLHFLFPFLYRVVKADMMVINEEEVGLIEAIDGLPLEPGRIFARHIGGHDTFQDGEAFLRNGGQKGPQIDILPPGKYRINTYLFRISTDAVITVTQGQVGIVTARDGEPITPGRLLAHKVQGHQAFQDGEMFLANGGQIGPQIEAILPGRYRINTDLFNVEVKTATIVQAKQVGLVTAKDGAPLPQGEVVAHSVQGHNDFQDGSAFLANGGQRGPQFDLLKPGTYYVNPLMFDVVLDDVAVVQRGEVAVLVSNVGEEPEDISQEERLAGKERYVVPAGFRGIQAEVAGPGVYYLNRWAYIAYIIPTTNLTIDWATEDTANGSAASSPTAQPANIQRAQLFNPLSVISRDGFEMRVSVKVVIRVRPDQAPLMVAKIGSIENLIDHVIHPMIDSSFRNQASSTEAMNFMQDRALEQTKAEERTRDELQKYHVECVSVLISQIILPQELMEIQTRRVIAAQQQAMFVEQQRAEAKRIDTENTRAKADQQINLVTAQIGVQVAEQTKQRTIIEAEGRARAVELEGAAEGSKILAVGSATAEAYQKQVEAVGQINLAGIEVTKSIAGAGLKITPDIMVGGGGDGGGSNIFAAFIAQLLQGNRTISSNGGDGKTKS
ncbi:MAG TPA: SPFH domain-containing protein [Dehalococcoidia bacterium]|jgi:regulator of protease activity HflC (stomatin/prohibitin superfamily)|nr:SPFH domain-containing protein [Dehalococcoidia bacterium]